MRKEKIKRGAAALAAAALLLALTGCGQSREEALELKYREKGIEFMNEGDYESALENFDLALAQARQGARTLETDICFYKAQALYLSGQKQEAMDLYTSIIELKGDARAYYLRGKLYLADSRSALALEDFEQSADIDNGNEDLLIGISESLAQYGLTDQSETYLTRALELTDEDPKKAADQLNRGRVLLLLDQYDAAEVLFQKAAGQGENEAEFYLYQLFEEEEKSDAAREAMEAYIGAEGADPARLANEGLSRLAAGDYDQAVMDLEAALELKGNCDPRLLLKNTLIANEYAGNFDRALELAEEYTTNYPDDQEGQKELTFLKTRV